MTRPDFFIVGAFKAGTTSLYEYLRQHPEMTDEIERQIRQSASGLMPMRLAVSDGVVEEEGILATSD